MLAPMDAGVALVDEEGKEIPESDDLIDLDEPEATADDDEVWLQVETVVSLRVQAGTIMAATVVATPAFAEGQIQALDALVASSAPALPPAEWFADPMLDGPTPMTITPEGRIFGHLAAWGSCHVGYPGSCVQPPTSATDYALFRLGERETDRGPVAVGQITLATNHAGMALGAKAAREHYEHTGAAVADVASGEDPHGIWVAGALRPGLSESQLVELRAAKLSGDWRDYRGNLEMIGALAVNVPGYPIPRGSYAPGESTDRAVSLIAAGALRVATQTARVMGRMTKVRRTVTAGATVTVSADASGFVAGLDALARRVQAPDLERLATRVVEPELARLAERV
jgi:hypothetical protein